jgi:hypothetical protein
MASDVSTHTYRIWLLHELFRGVLGSEQHQQSELSLNRYIGSHMATKPHLKCMLDGHFWLGSCGSGSMPEPIENRPNETPVVTCPGCDQPMEAKERTTATKSLVDIRYVCPTCAMETKRTIKDEGA